jgi:ArsR family transcriptional regulator
MKVLSHDHVMRVVSRARALGDATRVRIVELLARSEQPVGRIAQALSTQQSTVSKHLQVLYNAGLVQRRREASAVIYWTSAARVGELFALLGGRAPASSATTSRRIKSKRAARSIRSEATEWPRGTRRFS